METYESMPLLPRRLRLSAVAFGLALTAACGGNSTEIQASAQVPSPPATQAAEPQDAEPTALVEAAPTQESTAAEEPIPAAPDAQPDDTEPPDTDVQDTEPEDNEPPETDVAGTAGSAATLPVADLDFTPPILGTPVTVSDIGSHLQLSIDAYADPTSDPLQAAADITGFPLGLRPPVEGPLRTFKAEVEANADGVYEVWWQYSVENDSAAEYELDVDESPVGPPIDLLLGTYPPYWEDQGLEFQNTATYATRDNHPTGVGNYQIYYRPIDEFDVTTPAGVGKMWAVGVAAESDLDGQPDALRPGFRQHLRANFAAGVIPVPLIAAAVEVIPTVAGMTFSEARIASHIEVEDPESSFAFYGSRSMRMRITFAAPAGDYDEVVAYYAANPFDPSVIRYARIDAFAEPPVAIDDPFAISDDKAATELLLNDAYPGRVSMSAPDADQETFDIRIEFKLEPERPILD